MVDIKESMKNYDKLIESYECIDNDANVESTDSYILIEILMNLRKLNENVEKLLEKETITIQQPTQKKSETSFEDYDE